MFIISIIRLLISILLFFKKSGGFGKVLLVQNKQEKLAAKFGSSSFEKEYECMKKVEDLVSLNSIVFMCIIFINKY